MTLDKRKVLLVGSGLSAPLASKFDTEGWTVCCIHNAWRAVPDKWDILLHAQDFPDDRKPQELKPNQHLQLTYEWVRGCFANDEHGGFWRNHAGFGKTMFFSSFWWIMEHLNPELIGFIGCNMSYPEGNNTFYGHGSPDPLKYQIQSLLHWLGFLDGFCVRENIMLINYSPNDTPTLLPFSHGIFPNEKPEGMPHRAREHRTPSEYYK